MLAPHGSYRTAGSADRRAYFLRSNPWHRVQSKAVDNRQKFKPKRPEDRMEYAQAAIKKVAINANNNRLYFSIGLPDRPSSRREYRVSCAEPAKHRCDSRVRHRRQDKDTLTMAKTAGPADPVHGHIWVNPWRDVCRCGCRPFAMKPQTPGPLQWHRCPSSIPAPRQCHGRPAGAGLALLSSRRLFIRYTAAQGLKVRSIRRCCNARLCTREQESS